MIGIPLGLATANGLEWLVHKYVLHGLGRNKRSFWAFHWHEHHKASRREGFRDEAYDHGVLHWNGQGKEAFVLAAAGVSVTPLLPVAPFFVGTLWYSAINYYRVHKRSHQDPDWAREHLPWHYDHHMAPDQDANWCVTKPWFDDLMGTRKHYVGTEREERDVARKAARRERRQEQLKTARSAVSAA